MDEGKCTDDKQPDITDRSRLSNILAAGVYFSGFVKDLLCLPRPLSPPLTRITMSGSAALEYGFPSTHSTNAVSVAVFAILLLRNGDLAISSDLNLGLQALSYLYAFSIVLGRLYCGMHGFLDVFWGSALGAAIAFGQYYLGPARDEWLFSSTVQAIVISGLIVAVLIRVHPEPVDNCPCFDDSVAFAGTVFGIDAGSWHYATTPFTDPSAVHPSTVPFSIEKLGWLRIALRILLGVFVVFVWRAVAKPTMLRILPPMFRVVEKIGLDLPRRFFKPASQYQTVPDQSSGDNIIPAARDIPQMFNNLRRRRAISIGPQSEADAYEAMAYREKRRRDSIRDSEPPATVPHSRSHDDKSYFDDVANMANHSRKRSLSLEEFRQQMSAAADMLSPEAVASPLQVNISAGADLKAEAERDRSELFANVEKPRVRYDVEVVTKLIVYSGIGWLAVEGNPLLFHFVGLGPGN